MSFPRYPEYKNDAADWLKELPKHWSVARTKELIHSIESGVSVNSTDTPAAEGELGILKTSCVYHGEFDPAQNKAVLREEYDRVACPVTAGTLVVSRMNTPDLVGAAGFVRESREDLFLPDRLWKIRFDGVDTAYVHYWSLTPLYRAQVERVCAGTSASMQNLSQDDFFGFVFPLPSTTEQSQICTFLDRETAKIDELVAEQRRLLEVLKEKRQATISHAVTKGLNPHPLMRPSGIEWLGDIPAHWELKKLKYLGKAIIGLTYSPSDVTEGDEGTLVLRSSNVQGGVIVFDDNVRVSSRIPEDLVTRVGDILICSRNGSRALIGKNAVIDECSAGLTFGAFMTVFRSKHNDYLAYVLNSPLFEFQSGAFMTSTINQLTVGVLNDFEVPLPPSNERAQIAAALKERTSNFDTLIIEVRRAIYLLQERRSALISAAVTGQIDVRQLA